MKKRLFASLLALVMVIGMLPMTVLAETAAVKVAAIGETEYETLQAAIDAAEADAEIVLLDNITLSAGVTVAADDKLTIDLAGYVISYNPTDAGTTRVITNNGDLTIEDSSSNKTGKITMKAENPDATENPGYASNTIANYGKFTLNGGTIENTTTGGAACYAIDNYGGSTTVINDGKVVAVREAIRVFNNGNTKIALTVNGGELEGYYAVWVQLSGNTSSDKPEVDININGGTLNCKPYELSGYTYKTAIYTYSHGNSFDNVTIDIAGGTLNGELLLGGGAKNGATKVNITGGSVESLYSYNAQNDEIVISGGSFEVLDESLVPDTSTVIELDSGKTLVVPTLTAMTLSAATLALPEGDTAELTVASITPATSNAGPITWTSSDEAVATVDEEGTVTAVAVGTATITATSTYFNTIKATCEVTVTEAEEEGGDCEDDETSAIARELNSYAMWSVFRRTFTIQVTATTGGKVTASVPGAIRYDKSVTYTMTPDEGFAVAAVYVDGVNIGAKTEYTFSRVTKNHNLSVVFEEIED